ncbi:hypothetical protein CmeUKMEL1_17205 [Cryptosporidium meleagridis]|uniref:Uncharacterized protein n=1 Tax=Cryptosporidium meleagridis TaxID=93969 RepID=A0A2P4Z5Q6_9CRYT|nr:hypothetical protein CmeUKMEL1_17205 [Cryptosporidium meleagridis]
MSFKKPISAAIFIIFALIFQGILFDNGNLSSIEQLKYSFITLPRRYDFQRSSSNGCCSGLWSRFRSLFGSCLGSCSGSGEDEEVYPAGTYRPFHVTASGFTLHSMDLTLTCEKDEERGTRKARRDLVRLFGSYGMFGCTQEDARPACKELIQRIRHQTRKLNRHGMNCHLSFSNGVFSIH